MIIHGRRWSDDYDTPCDFHHIRQIKQAVHIPVIANGDISGKDILAKVIALSGCDTYVSAQQRQVFYTLVSLSEIEQYCTSYLKLYWSRIDMKLILLTGAPGSG